MNTKTHIHSSHSLGFTLIEIITVIAIIMALAAMTIGGMGYYKDKVAKSKTLVIMGGIESALEEYHADVGEYPPQKGGPAEALQSTKVLYRALYGDGIGPDGIAGTNDDVSKAKGYPDDGATVYLSMLDPKLRGSSLNLLWKDGEVRYVIVDGWADRLGYRCIPDGDPELMNPKTSFDLWSAGGAGNVKTKTTINNWK